MFSPSRIATPFQFSVPNAIAIFQRAPHNGGVECSTNISLNLEDAWCYKTELHLQWLTNRKSYCNRMLSYTLVKKRIAKRAITLVARLIYAHQLSLATLGYSTWSIEQRHFQWPWTTPNSIFKVTPLFDAEYPRNGTR